MLQIHNPLETDFEKIDVDPFWNVGNEVEHLNHKIHSYPAKFNPFEFVGEDDGNQVIRSGAGIAVDYNRHSQRENRTSDQNADDTNRHS